MADTPSYHMQMSDLPLWRLLVALDDAERVSGADSESARTLARAVRERMKEERGETDWESRARTAEAKLKESRKDANACRRRTREAGKEVRRLKAELKRFEGVLI